MVNGAERERCREQVFAPHDPAHGFGDERVGRENERAQGGEEAHRAETFEEHQRNIE